MKEAIVITNPGLARKFLRMGEIIVDIKPHKTIKNASVFVFKYSQNIEEYLKLNVYKKDSAE